MGSIKARIRLFYGPFVRPICVILAAIAVEEAFGLTTPWVQGRLINQLYAHTDLKLVALLGAVILVLWAAMNCLGHLRWRYNFRKIIQPLELHVMQVTMERLMRLSLAQHLDRHSGVKQSTIWEGQKAISSLMRTLVFEVGPMIAETLVVIMLLAYQEWRMVIILIVGAVLFALRANHMNRRISKPLKDLKEEGLREGKFRNDILRNQELVLLTAQEPRAIRETCESYGRILDGHAAIWLRYYNLRAMTRDLLVVATRGAILIASIALVWTSHADVGKALTWWVWTSTVASRISNIGWLWRDIMEDLASVKVFIELLEMETDVPETDHPIKPERFAGRIEVSNAYMAYSKRTCDRGVHEENDEEDADPSEKEPLRDSLRGVTLTIEPGSFVALVGPSGAGKTSLIYALMRGQDLDSGIIRIDGYDIRELALRNWRQHVGIVPQQVFMFDRSLRYNIAWPVDGRMAQVSDRELWRVVDIAQLHERIDGLEYGFDTEIGERGIRVSGGERQRIGIARALIANPDVLIFDEATSNLDAINERAIHKAIRAASKGRTTIVIAHRLSTVRDADCIFVMKDGTVVGQGRHEELMDSCSTYRQLVEHQLSF